MQDDVVADKLKRVGSDLAELDQQLANARGKLANLQTEIKQLLASVRSREQAPDLFTSAVEALPNGGS